MGRRAPLDRRRLDALALNLARRLVAEARDQRREPGERLVAQRLLDPLAAMGADVGEAHAEGRQQRRQRMNQDNFDR